MKIVFCLPGAQFSGQFIQSWSNLFNFCVKSGIQCYLRQAYTSNVFLCRNLILRETGANDEVLVDSSALFDKFPDIEDYDYLMWIDSDMVFDPADFRRLVDSHKDIVSGTAIIGKNGKLNCGTFDDKLRANFYTKESIKEVELDENNLLEVDFVGYAWILIKRGVFESMPYPWFRPMLRFYKETQEDGKEIEKSFFPSEDIGWCMLAKEAGFKIFVDPEVHVGHQKMVTLR